MYNLTRIRAKFQWTEAHTNSVNQLKACLSCSPILAHLNFDYNFVVQTDASLEGLDVVLSKIIDGQEHVVQYIIRVRQPVEKMDKAEIEGLAIKWTCEIFRPFLIGTPFILETDHHSLTWLMKATSPARLVRWALALSKFNFEIRHRRGTLNQNADGLSRLACESMSLDAPCRFEDILNTIQSSMLQQLKITDEVFIFQQRNDPGWQLQLKNV